MEYHQLKTAFAGLCLLSSLKEQEIGRAIKNVLDGLEEDSSVFAGSYAALFSLTLREGGLSDALERAVMRCANPFAEQSRLRPFKEIDAPLRGAAQYDTFVLRACWEALQPEGLLRYAAERYPDASEQIALLPAFDTGPEFSLSTPLDLYLFYRQKGYGQFSIASVFRRKNGQFFAVPSPDPIRLSDLKRYERQKQVILENTRLLLSGKRANNLLLYGDRGTGKSSTVKAVANEFAPEGLKLLEITKEDLMDFPAVCAEIARSPYPFIVFLDDLSFARAEDSIPLKAALEGGAAKAPDNMAVYATSNRRHLTEERFSDRSGDEIHVRDSIEALCSLSDRFGIEVVFETPGRDEYHDIVRELARDRSISLDEGTLCAMADRFALLRGVRSPRTANQFITSLFTQMP